MTPRVLLVTSDFAPFITGVGDYTDLLARHLAEAGADVTVLTSASAIDNDTPDLAESGRVNLPHACAESDMSAPYTLCRGVGDWSWRGRHDVLRQCEGFDVVHLQYPGVRFGRSPLPNLLPWLLRRRPHRPRLVATLHEFRAMRARWRARAAVMLGGVDAVVHVDPDDAPMLDRWSLPRRPRFALPIASNVVPMPCSSDQRAAWRRELGLANDEAAVAFFGIVYPHKGIDDMLAAVGSLRAQGRRVRPVVVGDFDREADWRPAIEAKLASPEVIWVRGASLPRVSEVLHACDAAMLPYASGAGVNRSSLLASLDHGLPVISTAGPATPADLGRVLDVSLVRPHDAPALAEALRRLLDDPASMARMRASGLENAAIRSWPHIARRQLDIYRQLLQPAVAGRGAAKHRVAAVPDAASPS